MGAFVDIRAGEGRAVGAAFASLFGITAAHTLLETARDALFLAKLPATRLAWVYLAVAAIGVAASWINGKRAARARARSHGSPRDRRGALPLSLIGAAVVNVALWFLLAHPSALLLYALYAWSAIFASWVIVELWLLLGAIFTVGMAKRLYGFVGAGAVLGAVSGAAGARFLAGAVSARHLIVAASIVLVATAIGPAMALRIPERAAEDEREAPAPNAVAGDPARASVIRDPYVRRVLLLVLVSTITFTAVDYLFKASVARRVPAAELGEYFASVYLVLNAAALVVQLAIVGWALRTFGVHRVVWAVPLVLGAGAIGVVGGGGLYAALILKGADGALRHSLHRTSVELLFVPMPDGARSRAKPIVDLVGQRGGQAIASVALLALAALGGGEASVAVVIGVLAIGWVAIAAGIRGPYLELFRATLRAGRVDTRGELPDLDLGALETLFAALNSKKDAEVIGALDLLATLGRSRLIPALILFHPSKAIVLHAFSLLPQGGRNDFVPVAERLLDHPDAEVRAAAFRARVSVAPDVGFLRAHLQSTRAELRATALVALVAGEHLRGDEAEASLLAVATGDAGEAAALAQAIAFEPSPAFETTLLALVRRPETSVQCDAVVAMGSLFAPSFLPVLVEGLPFRDVGEAACGALAELGAPALAYLDGALGDVSLGRNVRWGLPRAIVGFEPALAAPVLLRHLGTVPEGMLRYRLLRALVRIKNRDRSLRLDPAPIENVLDRALHSAFDSLAGRTALSLAIEADATRKTPAGDLLMTLLRDKQEHALERAFAALGLLHPSENFDRIRRGLANNDPRVRASSRELVENIVASPAREALLILMDELSDKDKLARAPQPFAPQAIDANGALRLLLGAGGELRALAEVHAAELGVLRPSMAPPRSEEDDDGALAQGVASLRGLGLAHG